VRDLTGKIGLFAFLTPMLPLVGVNELVAMTMGGCAIVACFFVDKVQIELDRVREEVGSGGKRREQGY
jgi:hypothetical protein